MFAKPAKLIQMDKYSDESGNNQREDSGKCKLPKGELQGTPEHGKLCGPGGRDFLNSRPTTMGKGKTMATKKQRAAARK